MNRLKLIIIGFLLAGMAAIVWGTVTQEYSSGAVSGRPLTVKKAVVTWDNTEGDYTNMNAGDEELDKDIFGYIERVTIKSTTGSSADTAFTISLLGEGDYAIFTKADCNSTDSTYSYMVRLADVGDSNYFSPVPVTGNCSITTENVTQVDEIQTCTADVNGDAGTYTISYGGETTAALAYDANTTFILNALEALSGIDTSGMTSVVSTLDEAAVVPIVLTFADSLGNIAPVTFSVADTNAVAVTVVETTDGGNCLSEIEVAVYYWEQWQ